MTDKTKKLFTQKELEHHIGARLMRERKKNTELMAFKGMLDEFISGGVFNADSYAEAGKRLMSFIAENYEAEEGESEAVNSAKDSLPTTENTQETDISEMADEPCDGISDGAEVSLGDDGVSPGEGVEETFTVTLKSKDEHGVGDKISRLCTELISLLTSDKETEVKSADELFARRSASSTGFSQRSAGEGMVCADSLTPTQREIARRAGISYREYAGLLREIPENISKRRPYR